MDRWPKNHDRPEWAAVVFVHTLNASVALLFTAGPSDLNYFFLWRILDLTVVAILVTVVSDLFTVLQKRGKLPPRLQECLGGGLQNVIFAGH